MISIHMFILLTNEWFSHFQLIHSPNLTAWHPMKFPKNLILVFLTVFIDCLGNSLTIPIMPFLMSDLGGGSEELGILYSSYCITQIFSTFASLFLWFVFHCVLGVWIMGTLSDKYGRKLFLIISLFGSWCGICSPRTEDEPLIPLF